MKKLLSIGILFFAASALADEAQIRRVLEPKLGGGTIEGIQPAPLAGLYEVRFRGGDGSMQIVDITIYFFMYPVIRPENADHSRMVLCSADRAKAWLELAAQPTPKVPQASSKCSNPVDKLLETGRKLGVNSTPTLFLVNGERLTGGLGPADLKELLDQTAAARP